MWSKSDEKGQAGQAPHKPEGLAAKSEGDMYSVSASKISPFSILSLARPPSSWGPSKARGPRPRPAFSAGPVVSMASMEQCLIRYLRQEAKWLQSCPSNECSHQGGEAGNRGGASPGLLSSRASPMPPAQKPKPHVGLHGLGLLGQVMSQPAPPSVGVVIRQGKNDKNARLYSHLLEFFSESSQSTTAFEVKDPSLTVTCLAVDKHGNLWSGHRAWIGNDTGAIRELQFNSDDDSLSTVCCLVPLPPSADEVISFDDQQRAWIGDENGAVRVLQFNSEDDSLSTVRCLVPLPPSVDEKPKLSNLTNKPSLTKGWYSTIPTPWDPVPSAGRVGKLTKKSPSGKMWRIMTGHENGQVLVWQPASNKLLPLLRVGEPVSPIRGLVAFDDWNLLVQCHANGDMVVMFRGGIEPPGSDIASGSTFGLMRPRKVIVRGNMSPIALMTSFGDSCVTTTTSGVVRGHKSPITLMTSFGESCVATTTSGTVRLWYAQDLANEAALQGLHTGSTKTLLKSQMETSTSGVVPSGSVASSSTPATPASYRQQEFGQTRSSGAAVRGGGGGHAESSLQPEDPRYARGSLQPEGGDQDRQYNPNLHQAPVSEPTLCPYAAGHTAAPGGGGGGGGPHLGPRGGDPARRPSPTPPFGRPSDNSNIGGPQDSGWLKTNTGASDDIGSSGPGSAKAGFGSCQMIEASEIDLQKLIGAGAYGKVG
eukprot:gene18547-25054_t